MDRASPQPEIANATRLPADANQAFTWLRIDRGRLSQILLASAAVIALTLGMLAFRDRLGVLNVMLLFVILSFLLGLLLETRIAAIGAVLAFLAYDVFFRPESRRTARSRLPIASMSLDCSSTSRWRWRPRC